MRADLLDPSTFAREDRKDLVAAVNLGALLMLSLPLTEDPALALLMGGGAAAYAALRKDAIGTLARGLVGRLSREGTLATWRAAAAFEAEHRVISTATAVGTEVATAAATEFQKWKAAQQQQRK